MAAGWVERQASHTVGIHPMVRMSVVTYSLHQTLARTPPRPQIHRAYEIAFRVLRESAKKDHRFAGG
jgi:hypothetical protein